jgi:Glycosyltransferase family 87
MTHPIQYYVPMLQSAFKRLPVWTWWPVAGLLALLSCAAGVRNALTHSQDFQWSPARVLLAGVDPYATWLNGDVAHQIILSQTPNYAHLLYLFFLPLGALPWTAAKALWAAANVLFALSSCWWMARGQKISKPAVIAVLCVFLISTPLRMAIGNGQQVLLALACLYWGWTVPGTLAASFFLALGFSKYTFVLPFALWLLLERRVARLLGAVVILGAGWLAFSALVGSSPLLTAFEPIRVGARAVGLGTGDLMSLSNALHLDRLAFPGIGAVLGVLCTTSLTLVFKGPLARMTAIERFAALGLIALMSFVHLLYDFVFLLPLVIALPNLPVTRRVIVAGGIAYFWFVLKLVNSLWAPQFGAPWIITSWLIELAMLCAFTGVSLKSVSGREHALQVSRA